jgi:uncharacterized protein
MNFRSILFGLIVAAFTSSLGLGQTPGSDDIGDGPLTIPELREGSYPGSAIKIERQLSSGRNYKRYLSSYQSEGLKIFALLTVPNGAKPKNGWPAIIFNHGYIPPKQYRTTEKYVAYVDGFARAGYIVFKPDYRGHGFSQGEPSGAYFSPAYTIDVLNATSSVAKFKDANPNRIGMWGHSMGGYLTLRSMLVDSRIKVGVIWAGVVAPYKDILERWTRSRPNDIPREARSRRQRILDKFGTPSSNPAFFDSISPNSYLSDGLGPLQIHHGLSDETVPYQFSRALVKGLRNAKQPHEYFEYAGNDHNLKQSFGLVMRRSVAFFDKVLKK